MFVDCSFSITYHLKTSYTNAKWQFAKSLKDYKGDDILKNLIFEFLSTGDDTISGFINLVNADVIIPVHCAADRRDFFKDISCKCLILDDGEKYAV